MRTSLLMVVLAATVASAETEQPYPPLIPKEATPYVAPTPTQKKWALATCGILTESNQGRHDLLGSFTANQANKEAELKLLARWWSVQSREDLLRTFTWIETGGHRRGFDELAKVLSKASPTQLKDIQRLVASDNDRSNEVAIVLKYKDEFGTKSIAAWDYDRYVALCGWGFLAGYLSEDEAWQRIMPVARLLQKTFSSWEELGRNHVVGREFWSWEQMQDRGNLTLQSYKKLLTEPSSPWVKLKWDLDLSPPKQSGNKAQPTPPTAPGEVRSGGRPAGNIDLYASGNNGCIIRINGEDVITVRRDKAGKARVALQEGDLITVRLSDRFDINSIWMSCLTTNELFLFETSERWTSYIPADTEQWWIIKGSKQQKPAKFATDKREYVNLVKKSAATTPRYKHTQPICSVLSDGTRIAYVYYVVTKQDLIPKK
ncbi:MAG: DUF1266 domain-containing protein [Kiritimatiellaeota bacterium]|nr:DUF1266 domain-containing protein [Kiritimatiellota bacterium]